MSEQVDRRQFLKTAAAVGAGLAIGGCKTTRVSDGFVVRSTDANMAGFAAPAMSRVRIGMVGIGARGSGLLEDFMNCDSAEIVAVCDKLDKHAAKGVEIVEKKTGKKPESYSGTDESYKKLCDRNDIDLVITPTPWDLHVPVSVYAMNAGKHVAVEVPAAMTVEDCWKLVETSEKTRKHCMMMENCCYGPEELMVLNMVRQGVFGQLTHAEGAYIHDLRDYKLSKEEGAYVDQWRIKYSINSDGNVYPTHGLGPIAQYMDINRGDRFDHLVSMSSPALGLKAHAIEKLGAADPQAMQNYKQGDMNTTLIKTARGRSIMIQHDTTTPRPYSRINMICGTKGIFVGYPQRLTFGHEWSKPEELADYKKKYEHPLWTKVGEFAKQHSGHGGMDFVMAYRLIDCLKRGISLDQDVYDAAAWSSVVGLSIKSVASRSAPIDVPDFTRGKWKKTAPLGIVT